MNAIVVCVFKGQRLALLMFNIQADGQGGTLLSLLLRWPGPREVHLPSHRPVTETRRKGSGGAAQQP